MSVTDHLLNFGTYGSAMVALCVLLHCLVLAVQARRRRRDAVLAAREQRGEREEVPPYPKKTSASA